MKKVVQYYIPDLPIITRNTDNIFFLFFEKSVFVNEKVNHRWFEARQFRQASSKYRMFSIAYFGYSLDAYTYSLRSLTINNINYS